MQLESGDFLHFYAAATPGWVADGNYTAGFVFKPATVLRDSVRA